MSVREHVKELLNKKIKDDKVISQVDLARAIGVMPATITKWLSGISMPDPDNIPSVCKVLNISLYEFFGIEDNCVVLSDEEKMFLDKIKNNPALREIVNKL